MTYDAIKFSKQQRKRSGKYFSCENCERQFYLSPSQAKQHEDASHRRGRFCSRKCQREFHAVIKTCPVCEKEFTVPQGTADRYTVCSWECRTANIPEYSCDRCGKTFTSREQRWIPKHCSEECRRPPEYITCKTCGIEFRKIPSDEDRQFCSFACYRKSNSETLIEERTRLTLDSLSIEYNQEFKCGRYSIDFYIPSMNLAIECDGSYWHQDKKKDANRDRYIKKMGIMVIHFSEDEIADSDFSNILNNKINHILNQS